MSPDFRTLVRLFLLVGGFMFAGYGVLDGSSFNVGFGVFAAILGAIGLWWQFRESSGSQ